MSANKLVIKDGKFFRGNELVKPEFGNIEQINAIKEAEKELAKGIKVKVDIDEVVIYTLKLRWTCDCGHENDYEETYEDNDPSDFEIEEILGEVNDEIECENCDLVYLVTKEKDRFTTSKYHLKLKNEETEE